MKKLCLLTGLIGAFGLCYFLFQNVFDHGFGWERIPYSPSTYSFQGKADLVYASEISEARIKLRDIHLNSKAPGISIAISIDHEIIWSEAAGVRDIENQIPTDTSTQFRIGSTSKALTSIGLGVLLDENAIQLDSSIQYYTGHFKNKPGIKIRQLASHQSGIRNYGVCLCFPIWEYYRDKYFFTVEESLQDFEGDALLFEPGEQFSYSSYNFTALSYAMEKAASTEFLELMDNKVFKPLSLRSTRANLDHLPSPNQTMFYEINGDKYKESPNVDLSNKWAGGGFLSTPSDLVKVGNLLLDNQFLTEATIQKLIEPQRLNNDSINGQKYAIGWRHSKSQRFLDGKKEVEIIHHGGMSVGSQSLLIVFPEYDMVVSLLMNRSGQQGEFLLFKYLQPIIDIFLSKLETEK